MNTLANTGRQQATLQKYMDLLNDPDFDEKAVRACKAGRCVMCGRRVTGDFSDEEAAFEYRSTALCERCQHVFFFELT